MSSRTAPFALFAALLGLAQGCTTVTSDLSTTQALYRDARYEQAQRWLSDLEGETATMTPTNLAHFCYLRGMTAFRLGQREDALHYLVLAEVLSTDDARALPVAWRSVMDRTLEEIMPTGASPHARNPLRPDTI